AWHYLRLESLALARTENHETLRPEEEAAASILRAKLLYGIGMGPKPPDQPIQYSGALPPSAARAFSVFRPPADQTQHYADRLTLVIDPNSTDDDLFMRVKEELSAERKKRGRLKATGQGKKMQFQRMWNALQLYKQYKLPPKRETNL